MNKNTPQAYHFNIQDACEYGVEEAIILQNIRYWVFYNQTNNTHKFKTKVDGKEIERYWMYNSIAAFCQQYPFWSKRQIERILNNLQNKKAILSNNFHQNQWKRTKWYTLYNDESPISRNGEMHFPKRGNAFNETGKSIYTNKKLTNKKPLSKDNDSNEKSSPSLLLKNEEFIGSIEIEILKEAIVAGGFTNHIKTSRNASGNYTKTFLQIIKYIRQINSGHFMRMEFDPGWYKKYIKKAPSTEGYLNWERTKRVILKSATMAGKARKIGIDKVPKSMMEWFYNPRSKKSRFLYFYNHEPLVKDEIKTEWHIDRLDGSIKNKVIEFYNKNRSELKDHAKKLWFSDMLKVQTWYLKNHKKIAKYNEVYEDNKWAVQACSLSRFFDRIFEYLTEDFSNPRESSPIQVNTDTRYWKNFKSYCLNRYGFVIDLDDDKYRNIEIEIKKQKESKEKLILQNKINKITDRQKKYCEEEGVQYTPLPRKELEKLARKELQENA